MKSENWMALGYRAALSPFPATEKADWNYCGAWLQGGKDAWFRKLEEPWVRCQFRS